MHTGYMFAYPVGGEHGASTATFLCVVAGVVALARGGRPTVLALLIAPFALGLLAAFLGRYPYGGTARIMQYLAPSICLLTGLGGAAWLARLPSPESSRRASRWSLGLLAFLGFWLLGRDLLLPYRVWDDVRTRDFARWFWTDYAREAELTCVKTDLGLVFDSHLWDVGMSAVYLFHQGKYSPRHSPEARKRFDADPRPISPARPLRLVFFDQLPKGHPLYGEWLASWNRDYTLLQTDEYVIHPGKPHEPWLRDAYVVLEFVPKQEAGRVARSPGLARHPAIRSSRRL
jgi:hypothetical protein